MSNEDRIKLYSLITDKYEVAADEIEKSSVSMWAGSSMLSRD